MDESDCQVTREASEGLLIIDCAALVHNYRVLRRRLRAGSRCGAVVKADAYGLGVARVVPALYAAGCRDFFVATLAEGEAVRPLLPEDARIVLLTGVRPGFEHACAESGLVPVLVTTAQLQSWVEATARDGVAAPCALKLDSGMTRLGMEPAEFRQLLQQPSLLQSANVQLFLSHLACADDPHHLQNSQQLQRFSDACVALRKVCPQVETSFANSSGIYLGEPYHFDVARPGAALYGVNPTPDQPNPMRAVVRLRLPVLQVRQVERDCAVGYGATQQARAGSWLAVVRGGYADGVLRTQSGRGRGAAVIGGATSEPEQRVVVPMIGRVSMDSCVFDISALSEQQRGRLQAIELLNDELTVDHMGAAAGTIGYEILTSLGHRYGRCYL
ncbi:alanine racemase [Microbulbifer salipaludis]|uniref:Alanine racemase n=1 Tax=Microbulbifer salipaludis TaxID=187980 RepID=A0ABS3E589_9GAMM|nr:alanine racemase [Microbulbifer salipaludis]MBN8430475.1 alanine racemase [Microbulbifer salipaludis]